MLCFARLGVASRRELAQQCRERQRSILVLDDLLAIFLACHPGSRLANLFACTLPFSHALPYSTASSLVPPEMFFGRTTELRHLIAPQDGRCFVYGGRLLGKTALMREARRQVHSPQRGRWALWVDLKGQGIGLDRGPEWIWPCLFREFATLGVSLGAVDEPNPEVAGRVDRFQDALVDWVNADRSRRILLLLDEADRFLEVDGLHDFPQATRLKSLMDRTDRRIKVVLAGLHNVLRMTKRANHPLAHLGEPINVGPLLHNGDWFHARALVEQPLSTVGYRLRSDSLVVRVLGLCNFYPSLIQLFCSELLAYLADPHTGALDWRAGPPYEVTEHHVEAVYRSPRLQAAIREKFQLTLQLDQRYDVIAHSLAQTLVAEPQAATHGLQPDAILRTALYWWPEGFLGIQLHELSVLLDEMEGLGILRRLPDGGHVLRNPNVVLLMGGLAAIEGHLLRRREAPATFDRETFRASTTGSATQPARHPLTYQQATALGRPGNAVAVVAGHAAAGIGEVVSALRATVPREYLIVLPADGDMVAFDVHLRAAQRRRIGATTLVLVPPDGIWNLEWVQHALNWTRRLRSSARHARVVFIADPARAWEYLHALPSGVEQFTLGPWSDAFLRQWLDDMGLPSDPERRAAIEQATGNWPLLVLRWHRGLTSGGDEWRQRLAALEEESRLGSPAPGFVSDFGLDIAEARTCLHAMAEHYPEGYARGVDTEAMAGLQDLDWGVLQRVLRWGTAIGIVQRSGLDEWRLDPVVSRVLAAQRA